MNYDLSVIIPTYNVERYILKTLSSISTQTFKGNIEIIVIDDCSTDGTVEIVKDFIKQNPQLEINFIQQEKNMRQGTARNLGVSVAKGKYVFFLDGDDFLDPTSFEKLFKKAEEFGCDFVICDWTYYYEEKGLVYVNNDEFMFKDLLIGKETELLYNAETYFTVNKLYNKEFLLKNNIKFGEGYIYEDFEFYIEVAQYANKVGVVQNPLYRVRVNEYSTTKTNTNSTLHVDSLLIAVENTLKKFNPRSEMAYYNVYKYLIKKTLTYLDRRAPKKYRKSTLRKVLELLNDKKKDYEVPKNVVPLYHFLFRRKYIQNTKVNLILFVWFLYKKGKLNAILNIAKKIKWKVFNSKIGKKVINKRRQSKINSFYQQPMKNKSILFLGFDYRYAGNSKYFFDYLKERKDLNIYFVTTDENVPKKYRITPRSMNFYEKLATSNIVIAESWVPLAFNKREGSTWIQLWHGTPFKKLFFDSHEFYISNFNKNHKRNKQRDISKWDYLLADSTSGAEKLELAFDFDRDSIMNYGYPRVQWLKDNVNNTELKNSIRKTLNIPENKKVLLYVPTWRDYNYKSKNLDLSYLLKVEDLEQKLGDEYVIIYKEHSMGSKSYKHNKNIIIPDDELETQSLILISDVIISDYSSIIFDGLAIDIPFYLYITDFEKYADARGVYEDMHEKLSDFYVNNEDELSFKLQNIEKQYPFGRYEEIKGIYSMNKNEKNAYILLENKINEILEK
ncbi:CDP-glycerol glycerophosphotransferase family protein [Ureibacillus sp. Re31]|uniref:CDP-glycerol glycerophosphotransferase family protein n=1 Tax=Ureibacillus galli TaxID=2762222 RepID=A0ABR8X7S7_9BACL|nr:CDP-glycerol glycerophosphotransferase family protein [Ureibacillus galli]MBD8025367.1 CDP-glycerol glycerophosphotransferase family protein [Ureibacillus galli]